MKKNKLTKILVYSVCSLVIAGVIFLAISYFGKEEPVQKKDSSQSENKQEQVEQTKDNKYNEVILVRKRKFRKMIYLKIPKNRNK